METIQPQEDIMKTTLRNWTGFLLLLCILLSLPSAAAQTVQSSEAVLPRVPVLAFHTVMPDDVKNDRHSGNNITQHLSVFTAQMEYLYDNDYSVLTAKQFSDFVLHGGELPPKPVLLTLDDGYLDNYYFVAPVLREFGFTAILYMVSGVIEDDCLLFTGEHHYMSFEQMEKSKDVFEFAPHSHTHDVQTYTHYRIYRDGSVNDIRADLQLTLSVPLISAAHGFAYPFGSYSSNAITALKAEGIEFAFTFPSWYGDAQIIADHYAYRNTNPHLIPRFSVFAHEWWNNIDNFSAVVSGGKGTYDYGYVLDRGSITVADASLAFRGVLGLSELTPAQKLAASMGEGEPHIGHVLRIFRYALGLTDTL
jgi:peptidoglycan/xylan/chitin deacetylase (PgdA/CDA1 family)